MASNRHPRPARGFGKSRWPDALLAAMDRETPFDMSWTKDYGVAAELASALHAPKHVKIANRFSGGFNVDAKLDASQVEDRRSDRAHYVPNANNHAIAERNAALRKKKIKRDAALQRRKINIQMKGAVAGDGRLERPAPRFGASSRDDYAGGAQAGASDRPRVQQHAKPKKKQKPRFNQGRHDA